MTTWTERSAYEALVIITMHLPYPAEGVSPADPHHPDVMEFFATAGFDPYCTYTKGAEAYRLDDGRLLLRAFCRGTNPDTSGPTITTDFGHPRFPRFALSDDAVTLPEAWFVKVGV